MMMLKAARSVYRYRLVVAVCTGLAFLLAVLRYLVFSGDTYEAEVLLVVTNPSLESQSPLLPQPPSPKVYSELLTSRSLLAEVLEKADARGVFPQGAPPLQSLIGRVGVRLDTVDPTTRPMSYSPIVTLYAYAETPEEAKALVDIWADRGTQAARSVAYAQVGALGRMLAESEQTRRKTLDAIRSEQEREMARLDTGTAEEELRQLTALIVATTKDRKDATVELAEAGARLEAVRASLADEKPVTELLRAPDDVAYWLLEGQRAGQRTLDELRQRGMVTQLLNDVYWSLRQKEQDALLSRVSAATRLEQIDEQLDALRSRQAELQTDLARHVVLLQGLQTRERVAETIYETVAAGEARYSEASALLGHDGPGVAQTLGLNRLSPTTAVVEASGFPRPLKVVLFTVVAFFVVVGFLVALGLIQPLLHALRASPDQAGPPAALSPEGPAERA